MRKRITKGVSLPTTLWDDYTKIASDLNISRSDLIARVLKDSVDDFKKERGEIYGRIQNEQ